MELVSSTGVPSRCAPNTRARMPGAGRSSRGWRVAGPIMGTLMMALGPSAAAERAPMAQSDTTARDAKGTIKRAALLLYQP